MTVCKTVIHRFESGCRLQENQGVTSHDITPFSFSATILLPSCSKMAFPSLTAASWFTSFIKCPYVSKVILILECPIWLWMYLGFAPRSIWIDAYVCRKSWKRIFFSPAFSSVGMNFRLNIFKADSGLPLSFGKIRSRSLLIQARRHFLSCFNVCVGTCNRSWLTIQR